MNFKKSRVFWIYIIGMLICFGISSILFNQQKNAEDEKELYNKIENKINIFFSLDTNSHSLKYILEEDSIINWNSTLLSQEDIKSIVNQNQPFITRNDTVYLTSIRQLEKKLIEIKVLPIFDHNGSLLYYKDDIIKLEKKYSYSFDLLYTPTPYPIQLSNNSTAYFYHPEQLESTLIPNTYVIISFLFGFLFFCGLGILFVHKAYHKYNRLGVWIFISLLLTTIIRLNQHVLYIPFNLINTDLFSAELFSSIGQVNSFAICGVSTLILVLISYSINTYIRNKELENSTIFLKVVAISILSYIIFGFLFPFIFSLIRDSRISFEFYDLNRINRYSFLGLYIISLNLLSLTICVHNIKKIWLNIPVNVAYKTLLIILIVLLNVIFYKGDTFTPMNIIHFCLIFFALLILSFYLPFPLDQNPSSLFSIFTIKGFVWYVLMGIFVSFFIYIFSTQKENDIRKELANSFFLTDNFKNEFEYNAAITQMFETGDTSNLEEKIHYLSQNIFSYFKHNTLTIFKSSDSKILHPILFSWYDQLKFQEENAGSIWSLENRLYRLINIFPLNEDEDLIVFNRMEIPYDYTSKILSSFDNPQLKNAYTVALFYNNDLISNSGNEYIDIQSHSTEQVEDGFLNKLTYSIYTIKKSDGQCVQITYNNNLFFHYFSILSYCLILFVFNTLLIGMVNRIWMKQRSNQEGYFFPFKLKINIGVILIVFFTFLIFAVVTTIFFYYNSKQKEIVNANKEKFNILSSVNNELNSYIQNVDSTYGILMKTLDQSIQSNRNNPYVKAYIYDNKGKSFSSFEETNLLDKEILDQIGSINVSPHLSQVHHFKNKDNHNYFLLRIGNKTVGIIQLSDIDEQNMLSYLLNDVISILINVYVFLLILGILLSIILAQRMTSSLNILTQKFRNIKLSGNKPIEYNQKDDLVLIVKEYNKMLKDVEIMAANLANSERESAWREAAKQVAHEINNPITPIKLNIQYLQKELEAGKDIRPLFDSISPGILEQIEQLSQIARSFSDFAKMPEPKMETMNLTETILTIIQLLSVDDHIKISIEKPIKDIIIKSDVKFINIIYINLLKNAIQATESQTQGEIAVTIKEIDEMVHIIIQDNGLGMDEATLQKIFIPNFTTKTSGSGIGLSTTKTLIQSIGGSISVESTLNQGASFYTEIPINQNPQ